MKISKFASKGAAAVALSGLALSGCSGVSGTSGSGDEVVIRMVTWLGPTTPYGVALEKFMQDVSDRSNGRIKVEPYWEGALLDGPDLLAGTAKGQADLAYMPTHYNPAELPLSQLTTVPFQTEDVLAAEATWEHLAEANDAYSKEWSSNGVTPLTIHGASANILATKKPVEGVAALKGMDIRATSYSADAVSAAGANAVALPLNEIYEALNRGVVDGYTTMNLGTVPSVSLQEVAPFVADAGLGMYATSLLVANADMWSNLSEEDRNVVTESIKVLDETYHSVLQQVESDACDALLKEKGKVTTWSEDETGKWSQLVGDSILNKWKNDVDAKGIDADSFLSEYQSGLKDNASNYESGLAQCAARS